MAKDLDCSDLGEVRRRVVEPVVRSLVRPEELERLQLRSGPLPGHQPVFDDDPEIWLVLTAKGEQFERRVCKATEELWSAQEQADDLHDALWDWLVETKFAWGQNRGGDFVVPPAAPTA